MQRSDKTYISVDNKNDSQKRVIRKSCFSHNCPINDNKQMYSVNRKLDAENQNFAINLMRSGCMPSEVLKVLKSRGVGNVTVTNMTNIQQLLCRDNNRSMWDFIRDLESTDHQFRWNTNTDKRICSVFFIHKYGIEEARRSSECIIIGVTYKTNSYKVVLLNFVVAGTLRSKELPKSLATMPIAGCWMDRETSERYQWALKSFRDIVWPAGTQTSLLPKCFVTDNKEALLKGIKSVFPRSKQILCWLHIKRNFLTRFKKNLRKEVKTDANELDLVVTDFSDIIKTMALRCTTKSDFLKAKEDY